MSKAVKELEARIRKLGPEDKVQLLRELLADLDGPADEGVERAWLEEVQHRYRELVEGKVGGIPGPDVFDRLWSRFGG